MQRFEHRVPLQQVAALAQEAVEGLRKVASTGNIPRLEVFEEAAHQRKLGLGCRAPVDQGRLLAWLAV